MTTLNKALEIKTLRDSIVSFNSQINFKQNEIDSLRRDQQALEVNPDNYTDQFDEFLDSEGYLVVSGLEFYPSRILKGLDPIAYRCGLCDYVDANCSVEDLEEYIEIEDQISDLEDQITEAEEEIQALEETE